MGSKECQLQVAIIMQQWDVDEQAAGEWPRRAGWAACSES